MEVINGENNFRFELIFTANTKWICWRERRYSICKSTKNHQALYQLILCQNQTNYHQKNANINVCLKAIQYIKQGKDLGFVSSQRKKYLATAYLKAGVLYHVSEKDYIKAYEFYMKAAKLGDKYAQNNLDILCKQHPWVCK